MPSAETQEIPRFSADKAGSTIGSASPLKLLPCTRAVRELPRVATATAVSISAAHVLTSPPCPMSVLFSSGSLHLSERHQCAGDAILLELVMINIDYQTGICLIYCLALAGLRRPTLSAGRFGRRNYNKKSPTMPDPLQCTTAHSATAAARHVMHEATTFNAPILRASHIAPKTPLPSPPLA